MVEMERYFHSVTLDEERCRGCTNCIKRCPTEAIRVRKGKARIINERCIDCGECIRVCPYHAKRAVSDNMEMLKDFEYNIAIPAPSLYGQFRSEITRDRILSGLLAIGFDDIFEVARGAEIVSQATRNILQSKDFDGPVISSACPAVVRLIQVRFPELIKNILKINSPMEVSAAIARKMASSAKGIPPEKIGIFFISPCAAKVTSVKAPYEKETSNVDGVIAIKDIYIELLNALEHNASDSFKVQAGYEGIRWADSGGERMALGPGHYLSVDGIHNVIKIFEEIEKDRLKDVQFVEALACTGGCLGGPLTVENPYIARSRLKKHVEDAKSSGMKTGRCYDFVEDPVWQKTIEYRPVMTLDDNFARAIRKLETLEALNKELPGLDCGACGAPTCRALAEDIVRGNAQETDCIFKLRERVRELAEELMKLEGIMPPVMDRENAHKNE